jgi:hypothetical protein
VSALAGREWVLVAPVSDPAAPVVADVQLVELAHRARADIAELCRTQLMLGLESLDRGGRLGPIDGVGAEFRQRHVVPDQRLLDLLHRTAAVTRLESALIVQHPFQRGIALEHVGLKRPAGGHFPGDDGVADRALKAEQCLWPADDAASGHRLGGVGKAG